MLLPVFRTKSSGGVFALWAVVIVAFCPKTALQFSECAFAGHCVDIDSAS
jgi:hypothetical protein